MKMNLDTEESIRCAASTCSCVSFKPGSVQLRSCDRCGHSWVAHALEKLQFEAPPPSSCGPVEVALPGLVFDLSSLVLYGAQAVPVRLKILLDRLYSVLTPDQVGHILHTLGWSLGDYVRGYMLQYPGGKVLDRWLMVTPEEELLILRQFLRFGETRPIVELMTFQNPAAGNHRTSDPGPKSCQPNISTIIKRNTGPPGEFRGDSCFEMDVCRLKKVCPADHKDTEDRFGNFPAGLSFLLPFHFPNSTFSSLVMPDKDVAPLSKITCLRRPNGTKPTEAPRPQEARTEQEDHPLMHQPSIKIKADPDKPNVPQSMWQQKSRFHNDQDLDLHRSISKQENVPSRIPTSSPFLPSVSSPSSSSPKIPQKFPGSSSYSLNPLPSFSSSFLCPLPTSSFSSSLRPLPSSLCALPSLSPAGGRKGRVCCGVCGKSFYDKGTLKIHYNAVHLKIKHRCTVAGCTMVFSSLRSRNRHSANPNPRLHTSSSRDAHTNRNTHSETHTNLQSDALIQRNTRRNLHSQICRDNELNEALWQQDEEAQTSLHVDTLKNGLNCHKIQEESCQENKPSPAGSSPPSSPPLSQTNHQNFTLTDLYNQGASPPPLLPARSASFLGSPPSLIPLEAPEKPKPYGGFPGPHPNQKSPTSLPDSTSTNMSSFTSQPVSHHYGSPEERHEDAHASPMSSQQRLWESGGAAPKKKPRKSSMPVKIERKKMEGRRNKNEEEG